LGLIVHEMLGYRGVIGIKDLLVISTNGKRGDYANINLVRATL
jgi:hypothetical protein